MDFYAIDLARLEHAMTKLETYLRLFGIVGLNLAVHPRFPRSSGFSSGGGRGRTGRTRSWRTAEIKSPSYN